MEGFDCKLCCLCQRMKRNKVAYKYTGKPSFKARPSSIKGKDVKYFPNDGSVTFEEWLRRFEARAAMEIHAPAK